MLGLVRSCTSHLDPEVRGRWRAHLCGLCLTLRDTAGQPARACTNTDAALLSALVEAQQPRPAATRTAGPCALRGMRRAEVIAPAVLRVRRGATAALTRAAAKGGDRGAEREAGLCGAGAAARGTVGLLRATERRLGRSARADGAVAAAARVPDALAGLAEQARIESRAADLAEVTGPTASAVGDMFAASAVLAGRPENEEALRETGRAYGEFAHLADALEDLPRDRARGDYNPLDATGTSVAAAVARLEALRAIVIDRLGRIEMRDDRLVRPLLLTAMATVLVANGVSLEKKGPSGRRRKTRKDAAKKRRDDGWCDGGDCGDCCCGDGCCDCS